jgi:hypothetical protein
MRRLRISKGGQADDQGDRPLRRPVPDDPIVAARGALGGRIASSDEARRRARRDEQEAEDRRWRER